MKFVSLGLAAALLLGGCATKLSTLPDRDRTAPGLAITGQPYSLPILEYDATLTRALSSCPKQIQIGAKAIYAGDLSFGVKAEATASYAPGERYLVHYERLRSPFATSDLSLKLYPSGILKSVDASADDQSAEVVKQVVDLGISVASVALSGAKLPAAAAAAPLVFDQAPKAPLVKGQDPLARLEPFLKPVTMVTCTPAAADLVQRANDNSDLQDDKSKALDARTRAVTRLTLIANMKRATSRDVQNLAAALADQDQFTQDLKDLQTAGDKLTAKLSAASALRWPRRLADRKQEMAAPDAALKTFSALLEVTRTYSLAPEDAKAWWNSLDAATQAAVKAGPGGDELAKLAAADPAQKPPEAACASASSKTSVQTCLAEQLHAWTFLRLADGEPEPCAQDADDGQCTRTVALASTGSRADPKLRTAEGVDARDDTEDAGLFVRSAAQGVMLICRGAGPPEKLTNDCGGSKELFNSKAVSAPQLGQLRFLPFRNGAFEASELSLEMGEDGTLTTFEYKRTRAAGVAAAQAAAGAAQQIKAGRDALQAQKATDLKTKREAAIASLQFQIDTLTAQKALLKLQTPDPDDPLQAIKDETSQIDTKTALLKSELAQLQAQAALDAASAP